MLLDAFRSHISKRYNFDTNSTLNELPLPDNAKMQFKSHKNKLRCPYIMYADTECSLAPTGLKHKTRKYIPNAPCFYIVCDHDPSQSRLEYYIGGNCIVDKLIEITEISDQCMAQMKKNRKMVMSAEDMMVFKNATHTAPSAKSLSTKLKNGVVITIF